MRHQVGADTFFFFPAQIQFNKRCFKNNQCFYSLLLLLLSRFSRVRLCATPQTAAQQAPLSLGFSRQEHWSELPFPSPMRESEVAQQCPILSDPTDAAYQAPPSIGFSRQEYCSGVPLPSLNDITEIQKKLEHYESYMPTNWTPQEKVDNLQKKMQPSKTGNRKSEETDHQQ